MGEPTTSRGATETRDRMVNAVSAVVLAVLAVLVLAIVAAPLAWVAVHAWRWALV